MDKIITGIHLPSELCSLIEKAEEKIYIICPFIELHHHFKRALKKHVANDQIQIVVRVKNQESRFKIYGFY